MPRGLACTTSIPCISSRAHSISRPCVKVCASADGKTTTASPAPAPAPATAAAPAQASEPAQAPVAAPASAPVAKSPAPSDAKPATSTSGRAASGTKATSPPPAPKPLTPWEQRMQAAYTMSQLYAKERPAPIPSSQHEERRRKREFEEISASAKRKGIKPETIKAQLEEVDKLLPGLVNLHKAKAADWVTIISDANAIAARVIMLKEYFPKANMYKIVSAQPKLLLQKPEQLQKDAELVKKMLSTAPDADAIVEAVPDLLNPVNLSRALASLSNSFKGADPMQLLAKHPDVLLNMGEASIEDSAEYGELSTKD